MRAKIQAAKALLRELYADRKAAEDPDLITLIDRELDDALAAVAAANSTAALREILADQGATDQEINATLAN